MRLLALFAAFVMMPLGATALQAQSMATAPVPAAAGSAASTGSVSGATTTAAQRDDNALEQSDVSLLDDQRAGRRAAPFGSELFRTTPQTDDTSMLDPGYVMQPGDTVQISESGMINTTVEATVDPSGNVIVPGVGPVRVAGVPASRVNATIQAAARGTFRDGVTVYAAPTSATKISVFVTGPVVNPGIYSGSASESIVGFLQRAGGPDASRGSYRHIFLRRNGRVIANLDLYAFLSAGVLPEQRLQQGDVIVVGAQGPVITVSGAARAPFTFELFGPEGDGAEVLRYARPRPEVTDVSVLSIRDTKPINEVMPLPTFAGTPLNDGDRVLFEANARADTYVVRVEGAVMQGASFVVPRGERLGTVLQRLQLDPLADRSMIHLRRASVAASQKRVLNESLDRLERVIYTTPSATSDVAQQRQVDSLGLQQYIARARAINPPGLVSLRDVDPAQIILEPEDVIVVPFFSQNVIVGGEVALPQSFIADSSRDSRYYIQKAGGFTPRADKSATLVVRPDGSAQIGGAVSPGDRVIAAPKAVSGGFNLIKDITTILYQLAIAAVAVF